MNVRPALCLLWLFWAALAGAQTYPARPVRIIVAVGPGGGDDFTARQVAAKLSETLGQQFFVENRPGASGMIGQTYVAKSAPDGYTLLLAGGSMAGAHYVNAHRGYGPAARLHADLAPRAVAVRAHCQSGAAGEEPERVDRARARESGQAHLRQPRRGTDPILGVVLFNSMAKIHAVEVQYKSPADAQLDIIAGRVDYFVAPVVTALGAKEKARVLGVTTQIRSEMLPDVPTIDEAGLPGYDMPRVAQPDGPGRDECRNRADVEPRRCARPAGARPA